MPNLVRFGAYEVDLAAGQLSKRGVKINLRGQSFQVLASLLEHPGEVVTREELRQRLWHGDVFVDFDNNLNTAIARLRQALCDSPDRPRFIETLPKRGYRFIGNVFPLSSSSAVPRPVRRPRLVVLPFVNLSGDPAQEYFSDAMTDEIITALAGLTLERLAVIARTTAMHYKGSRKDIAQIGRELNADCVVEGAVERANDHVTLNLQLIQAADQTHLFAQKYDAPMRDIFSLHHTVARALASHVPLIADAMRAGVVLPEHARRKPTEDLAAYNEYIKGRYHIYRLTAEGTMEAKRHFEAALARDPAFALACNALSELYWYLGLVGFAPSRETDPVGRSYALRALEIDSTSADAHALLSFYPQKRDCPEAIDWYNWEQILKDVARARQLDPTSRLVRLRYAMVQAELGFPDEAVAELERALESDPLDFDVNAWLVIMLYLAGHSDQALQRAMRVLDLEPEHFVTYDVLGQVYLAMQRFDESAAAFRKGVELSGELPLMLGWLGLSSGLSGHTSEARAALERLHLLAGQRYVAPTPFAWTYVGLGNTDEAFKWMERAVDAPDRMMEAIKTYPFLDPLRTDPRFAALLRKMNLEP
jgi:TolB-like protein/Flp pilus assembly protein TadD